MDDPLPSHQWPSVASPPLTQSVATETLYPLPRVAHVARPQRRRARVAQPPQRWGAAGLVAGSTTRAFLSPRSLVFARWRGYFSRQNLVTRIWYAWSRFSTSTISAFGLYY